MNSSKKTARFINNNRAYLLVLAMLVLGLFAKNFFSLFNITSIFNSTLLYAYVGLGFTLCMIAGHMDLSVGALANLGAVITMGMHTNSGLGWGPAIVIALIFGTFAGIFNGIMVSKAKIHSFVATLGMQFVLKGVMYIYCGGAEIGDKGDFAFADVLNKSLTPLPLSPKIIITLIIVIAVAIIMKKTRFGRNIYMIGGNAETAWLAGINRDLYQIIVFAISGFVSALGGALFAICQSSAAPNLGEKGIAPLMVGLAATIIGGTSTSGGKGSVWNTFISVLGLMAMFNVLTALVGKFEVQILANGAVLAAIVIYETVTAYYAKRKIGMRAHLIELYKSETGRVKI